jgi:hypothetical protein
MVLVQAFSIFLLLAQRDEDISSRFVYMMVGLLIRMAQYLGFQRDGAGLPHLSPYEVEIRRRVWYALCMMDLRAAEDQGTQMSIPIEGTDTKFPLNINDTDLDPESKEILIERTGITDTTFSRMSAAMVDTMRQVMTSNKDYSIAGLEHQERLLNRIYERYDKEYFQYKVDSSKIVSWVIVATARLVVAKMRLFIHLPVLSSTANEQGVSEEIRNKLLVSSIEVAEYNHNLNADEAGRQWRWVYQTHTHWHAIVLLMIEITRRAWSPLVERAFVALQSPWLIPAQAYTDKSIRTWVPLRKLMVKVRKHRENELRRLRADLDAATRLVAQDEKVPAPGSSGPFPGQNSVEIFRQRWEQLLTVPQVLVNSPNSLGNVGTLHSMQAAGVAAPGAGASPVRSPSDWNAAANYGPGQAYPGILPDQTSSTYTHQLVPNITPVQQNSSNGSNSASPASHSGQPIYNTISGPTPGLPLGLGWGPDSTARQSAVGANSMPWLWGDFNPSAQTFPDLDLDLEILDSDVDLDAGAGWLNWVDAAKSMESNFSV